MPKKDEAVKHKKKRRKNGLVERTIFNISKEKGSFSLVEAYKTLRTNVIFSTRDKKNKVFVITSPVPGDGKTTTAVNLAISFAETGKKVLILDADLRKPRVHKYFDLTNKIGISNILSGVFDDAEQEVVQHSSVKNLDVITSGHIPPNPIELLSSERIDDIFKSLKSIYDIIIIDTPPINIVSDALVLSKYVDGYILVVRNNHSDHQSLANAISKLELADVKPLGIVLNDYDEMKKKYTSRYRYNGYYYYYRTTN